MKQLKIKDLKPNPQNPRRITPEKIADLKRSYEENGDLGGVVFNVRSQQLIGGHQTARSLDPEAIIHIEKKYKEPTKTGTVAEGYVDLNGERLKYREVDVDSNREKVMNIAANRGAGSWDFPALKDWFHELDSNNFDLNLTMFDEEELANLMAPVTKLEPENTSTELDLNSFDNFQHQCPKCGFEWNDNGTTDGSSNEA